MFRLLTTHQVCNLLEEKVVAFRIRLQLVADMVKLLPSVQAEAGSKQMISVWWKAIALH